MGGFISTSPFVQQLVSGQTKAAQYKQAPTTVVPQVIKPAPVNVSTTRAGSSPSPSPTTPPGGGSSGGGGGGDGSSSGGGGSYTQTYTPPDPYAAWGGKANYDRLVNDFNVGKTNAMSDVTRNEGQAANNYNSSILDYIDQMKAGQTNIDNENVNNELARKQGTNSILDMVSHGIRSSAVRLAAGNAASSSAAGQLAAAWADNGRQQEAGVDNQYELGKNNIANEQSAFDTANATTRRHIGESKANIVNDIVNSATQALADINNRAAYANLPDRIDLENEKQRIAAEALGKLQAYDASLNNPGVAPISPDAARAKAFELSQAGHAATNPFTVNSVIPVNAPVQSSAAPLAFYPTKKDTNS